MRAQNGESPSEWSAAGTGRTSIGNSEPTFDDRSSLTENDPTTTRTVAENTRAGQSVGRAVGAVDGNGDRRTYRLVAAPSPNDGDVDKFDITATTGQIMTKDPLNHEAECSGTDASLEGGHQENCTYTVVVQVWDGLDEDRDEQVTSSLDNTDDTDDGEIIDDTITVTITVSDVAEKPVAPTVTVTSPTNGTSTSLVVTWDEPANAGPPITGYRLECTGHEVPDDQCPTDIPTTAVIGGVGTHTITGLTEYKSYRVRVRADNVEGDGTWSSWKTQFTNKENNDLPTFTSSSDLAYTVPDQLYVVENAPSARQPLTSDAAGATVASIQKDDGNGDSPLTLRLEGADAGRFDIVASTGQIVTKSKLNHEDPDCYNSTADPTTCTYNVRVKLSDPNGGSAFHALTIDVTDADEPPEKPAAPRVTATSGSGWSLQVTWNAPRNDGPPITGYQIRYRKTGDSAAPWRQWPSDGANVTGRSAKITTIPDADDNNVHLEPRKQYEVQVRALNGEGDPERFEDDPNGNWSTSGRGTTAASNERPVFDSTLPVVVMLEVEENTRSGQSFGSATEATDPDGHRLTYTLEGPGKDSFTITSAGQIRTRSPLNHEERDEYSLTVKVDDRQRKNNSVAAKSVTIEVTDRSEQPSAPRAPRVAGIPGSTDSVRVTWDEPANTGPDITHYSVQYAVGGSSDAFQRVTVPTGAADRSVIITGLTAGTRYNVQVRAESPEGHSDWSRSGAGSPNPDVENRNPAFSGRSHTFNVAENTPPGTDVGNLVAALDPDGDTLTYILEGVDADSFDIIATNGAGQIQTKAALNHEEKASYSVAVRVRDGRGGTDAVNVTIRVTDVNDEAPDTPFAPAVVALSSTSLQVTWDAPENAGPPITDYDYRYQALTDSGWTEVTNTTITGTTTTVDRLTPSTSYDVEVRARNAEGTSGWSNPGNGATNEPGANNPPVFSDGASATRSVSAAAPSGTLIGLPVAATDADTGDTVTYSLEGRDAPSFDINETNGQLRTKSGITLLVGTTYTVTVVADDTKDTTSIAVSIEATAAPPNRAPVFSEGASTTRSVREDAATGTNVGSPVTATDADTGDTRTYSLEGTDAASFDIVTSSGQIQTRAALDASTKATYSVTVRATDSRRGSATIGVTITVTARPTTFGCATRGAVSDASNVGLVADCEALLAARDRLQDGGARLNWWQGTPIADWEGITLRGTPARVAWVDLRARGLSGTIPAELGQLSMLTELNLRSNDLTGSIPPELNSLTRLEKLLLHNNRLTGAIPDLSRLRNLKMLWLSGRDMALTGGVPTWLNTMNSLEELTVWGNDLGGTIPYLAGMSSLKRLDIRANGLTGSVPAWLGDMDSLGILYLASNDLSGEIPEGLSRLTGLVRMWLDRNDLTGSIPAELGSMTNLRTLNLRDNQLTGSIPPELSRLSNLVHLRLHNNMLTGSIPPELGRLSKVTQFYLSGHNMALTGSIPPELGDLDSVMHLSLWGNNLTGPIPPELDDLGDTLTRLRLGGNTGLTGCVPRSLSGATDATDLSDAGLSICP